MRISEDATLTTKGQVTIPKEIRDALDLEAGTELEFTLTDDGEITVRPKRPAMEQLRAVQGRLSDHDVDLDAMREESREAWRSSSESVDDFPRLVGLAGVRLRRRVRRGGRVSN
jgi:AbrB family looped-hinge helix DNA binding protein